MDLALRSAANGRCLLCWGPPELLRYSIMPRGRLLLVEADPEIALSGQHRHYRCDFRAVPWGRCRGDPSSGFLHRRSCQHCRSRSKGAKKSLLWLLGKKESLRKCNGLGVERGSPPLGSNRQARGTSSPSLAGRGPEGATRLQASRSGMAIAIAVNRSIVGVVGSPRCLRLRSPTLPFRRAEASSQADEGSCSPGSLSPSPSSSRLPLHCALAFGPLR
jgi:hypothetical protein